jgi:hypothetical protein
VRGERANESWLPTEADEWLIRAGVETSPQAVARAWSRWRRVVDLDDARHEAAQLLPLVYRNLTRHGIDDPELPRLKGIYRFAWSRNQLLFRTGATAIEVLRAAGIQTIVLKGAALSVLSYRDPGARQMTDFDLLVPRARAMDAIAALREAGLRPHEAFAEPERRVSVHHSTSFVDEREHELDLHWYALFQSSPEDEWWRASIPIEIAGTPSRALCPADQLLQVCAHGAHWTPAGSMRWVADSLVLIRDSASGIDWDRVGEQAIRRRLTPTILDALAYLRRSFDAEVPPQLLDRLRGDRVPLVEAVARRAARAPTNQRRILISQWNRYRRLKRLDPAAPREPSFPAQLKNAWGAPSYRAFSLYAARRLLRIGR